MKTTLCYAVLGNSNVAAGGLGAAIATSWLHGAVHYHENYKIEIPDSLLSNNNLEKYAKSHSGDEFIRNVLFPHNPSLPEKFRWKDVDVEYSPKYHMLRILRRFEGRGLFIELPKEEIIMTT